MEMSKAIKSYKTKRFIAFSSENGGGF